MKNLSVMYANGEGVPRDYVGAYEWAYLAVVNGDKRGADLLEKIAKMMTPSQLEEAQRLASECVKNDYKGC